ncbi:MAG TPA: SgcJ/EcaC family oxidoreductase [Actinomycetes bacterium]|jgi:uncharacterized protein (TIGR02246 family)|nr:SgcJ/EcaC family oxidoreductase [Actinomycetes bacterium]
MSPDATDAVRALFEAVIAAWNARDADAFAAAFTDGGSMVGFDGSQAVGPDDVRDHLAPVFADHPTASYVARVDEIRALTPDVALLRATVGMVPPDGAAVNPAVNALQVIVGQRRSDGVWRLASLQTTPAQYHGRPDAVTAHTAAMQHLVDARVTVA